MCVWGEARHYVDAITDWRIVSEHGQIPQIIRQKKRKAFFVQPVVEKLACKNVEIVENPSPLPTANNGRRRGRFRIRLKGRSSVFLVLLNS